MLSSWAANLNLPFISSQNSYYDGALRTSIISNKEIAAMKDFSFIDWEVHTDLDMQVSVDNSWHPSKVWLTLVSLLFLDRFL